MESYHPYPPFGNFGAPSTHYAPVVHSHSTIISSTSTSTVTEGPPDPRAQTTGKHSENYYSNSVHPHSSNQAYAAAPPSHPPPAIPAHNHNPQLSAEVTPAYAPDGYHESSYSMYNPQPFGMDVGLGMGVEPPFAMGVAGGFDTMANYGGFDASVNADLGGGVGAGPYPTYAYQNSIDDRTAFATHAHFVQQQANYPQSASTSTTQEHTAAFNASTQLHEGHMGYAPQAPLPQPTQDQFVNRHQYAQAPFPPPEQTQQHPPSQPQAPAPLPSSQRSVASNAPAFGGNRSPGVDRPSGFSVTPQTSSGFASAEANAPGRDRHRADHSHVDPQAPPNTNNSLPVPRRQTLQVTPIPRRARKTRRSNTTGTPQEQQQQPQLVQFPPAPFVGTPTFPASLRASENRDDGNSNDPTFSNPSTDSPGWQQHPPPAALHPPNANWARTAQLHQAKLQQQQQPAPPSSSGHGQSHAHTRSSSFSSSNSLTGALDVGGSREPQHPSHVAQQQPMQQQLPPPSNSYSDPSQVPLAPNTNPGATYSDSSQEHFVTFGHQNEEQAQMPSYVPYDPYGASGTSDKGYQRDAFYVHQPPHAVPPVVEQQNVQQNGSYDQHYLYHQQSGSLQPYHADSVIHQQTAAVSQISPESYEQRHNVQVNTAAPIPTPISQLAPTVHYQHVPQQGDAAGVPYVNVQNSNATSPIATTSRETSHQVSNTMPSVATDATVRKSSQSPPLNRATLDMADHIHSLARAEQRYELVRTYVMRHGHAPPPEWRLGEEGAPSALERAGDLLARARTQDETMAGMSPPTVNVVHAFGAARLSMRSPMDIAAEINAEEALQGRDDDEQDVDTDSGPVYQVQDAPVAPSNNRRHSIIDPSPIEPHEAVTPTSPTRVQSVVAQPSPFIPSSPVTQQENENGYMAEAASPFPKPIEILSKDSNLPLARIRQDGHVPAFLGGFPGEAYDGRSYLVDDPVCRVNTRAPLGARVGDMPDVVKPHPMTKPAEDYHLLMASDAPFPPQAETGTGPVEGPRPKLKLTTTKKSPPKLACLFCRARKIACGPGEGPGEGRERTCNQCERRKQQCTFPTESKRGIRSGKYGKKKKRGGEGIHDEEEDEEGEEGEGEGGDEDEEYVEPNEPGPSTPKKRKRSANNTEKSRKRGRGRGKGRGKGKAKALSEVEDDVDFVAEDAEDLYLPEESPISARPDTFSAEASSGAGQVSMDEIFIFDQQRLHMQAQAQGGLLPHEYFEDAYPPTSTTTAVQTSVEPPRPIPASAGEPSITSPTRSPRSETFGPFTTNPLSVPRGRKAKRTRRVLA